MYQKYYVGQKNPLESEYHRPNLDASPNHSSLSNLLTQLGERLEFTTQDMLTVLDVFSPVDQASVKYVNFINNASQLVMIMIVGRDTDLEVYTLNVSHTELFHSDESKGDIVAYKLLNSKILL
jgi:hypothetical protein